MKIGFRQASDPSVDYRV